MSWIRIVYKLYPQDSKDKNSIGEDSTHISSESDKSAPIGSGILLPLIDKTFYDVPVEKIKLWQQAFPGVDIHQELRKMITWCDSNPKRKKTRRGIDRFINNWLERAQNSGRSYQGAQAKEEQTSKITYEPYQFDYSQLPDVDLDASNEEEGAWM